MLSDLFHRLVQLILGDRASEGWTEVALCRGFYLDINLESVRRVVITHLRLFDLIIGLFGWHYNKDNNCYYGVVIYRRASVQDRRYHAMQLLRNKDYLLKVEDLFRCGEGLKISKRHLDRRIVTNPKCFFDLVESNFLIELRAESLTVYYEVNLRSLS